jgi:alkylhydroperoxidase family enzyme
MLRALIESRISAAERRLGVPADYMRHMLHVSLRAFLKFTKIMPVAEYRRTLPAEPFHVARIAAVREEDCGSCLQIEINLAKRDKVKSPIIRAAASGRPDDMPEHLADVYRFAEAVVRRTGDEDIYRERIREAYGDEALVELAIAIAVCRVFPTTKRALGYAKSCSAVHVHL